VVLVTGIGQVAKIVYYMRVNGFDGLHGGPGRRGRDKEGQ